MTHARVIWLFILALISASPAISQTSAPSASAVITDPAQITSKEKFDVQPLSIDKLFMSHSIGQSTWSPDGKQIAFISNISGRNNIWLVSAQSGWPMQLTVSNQRQANITWSPKGRWIAYASDDNGNEQYDLFLVSTSNGQVVNLTNTPEISEEGAIWSPDGERLAYSVKPKEASNYEIDVMEIETKKVTHITQNTAKGYQQLCSCMVARRQMAGFQPAGCFQQRQQRLYCKFHHRSSHQPYASQGRAEFLCH